MVCKVAGVVSRLCRDLVQTVLQGVLVQVEFFGAMDDAAVVAHVRFEDLLIFLDLALAQAGEHMVHELKRAIPRDGGDEKSEVHVLEAHELVVILEREPLKRTACLIVASPVDASVRCGAPCAEDERMSQHALGVIAYSLYERGQPMLIPGIDEHADIAFEECEEARPERLEARMEHCVQVVVMPSLGGAYSLIWRSDDYRRAFKMASDSPYLGMKLCTGCWLEGGETFGNLMDDIAEFAPQGKIHVVHFRNVSSTMPYFEEVLAEDGYADMFSIAKQLVKYGFDGTIDVDHVYRNPEWAGKDAPSLAGGSVWSAGYATGYMKGLIDAAYKTQEGGC